MSTEREQAQEQADAQDFMSIMKSLGRNMLVPVLSIVTALIIGALLII